MNPFAEWTTATAAEQEAVESAEWAARAPLSRLTEAATAEARRMAGVLDPEAGEPEATVFRAGGRLIVDLSVPSEINRRDAGRIAVRIADELRRVAPRAGSVDVRLV